jgi:hypothetical protein
VFDQNSVSCNHLVLKAIGEKKYIPSRRTWETEERSWRAAKIS